VAAERLERFFSATVELMTVLARAAGHHPPKRVLYRGFNNLYKADMAQLTGVAVISN